MNTPDHRLSYASLFPTTEDLLHAQECLRRFFAKRTKQHADMEDLVQSTLERALVNASSFESEAQSQGARVAWLLKVARTVHINHIRDAHVQKRMPQKGLAMSLDEYRAKTGHEMASRGKSPVTEAIQRENIMQFREALKGVQENYARKLIPYLIRQQNGEKLEDLAKDFDCTDESLRSRLGRARKHLRKLLEKFDPSADQAV